MYAFLTKKFDDYVIKIGFKRSRYDHCIYIKHTRATSIIFLLLHIDDMLMASTNRVKIDEVNSLLKLECKIKDLGIAIRILEMEVEINVSSRILFQYSASISIRC